MLRKGLNGINEKKLYLRAFVSANMAETYTTRELNKMDVKSRKVPIILYYLTLYVLPFRAQAFLNRVKERS